MEQFTSQDSLVYLLVFVMLCVTSAAKELNCSFPEPVGLQRDAVTASIDGDGIASTPTHCDFETNGTGHHLLRANLDRLYAVTGIRFEQWPGLPEITKIEISRLNFSQDGHIFNESLIHRNITKNVENGVAVFVFKMTIFANILQLNIKTAPARMAVFDFTMYGCPIPTENFYSSTNGTISSEVFHDLWAQTSYRYTITTDTTKYIEIQFKLFNIKSESNQGECDEDSLEVMDNAFRRQTLTGKRCGDKMPHVRSSNYTVVIILTVKDGESKSYFEADYFTVDTPGCEVGSGCDDCIHTCNMQSAFIASYPRQRVEIQWEIEVPVGSYVHIDVIDFDLGLNGSCEVDSEASLEFSILRNGETDGDAVNPKVCRGDEQFDSLTHFLRVIYKKVGGKSSGNGFMIRYTTRTFQPELIDKNVKGSCPENWTKYNDQCYLLERQQDPITWYQAYHYCIDKHDGNITNIRSHDEMQFVHSLLLSEVPDIIGGYIPIGLQRDSSEDQKFHQRFRWITRQPANYMSWYLSSIYTSGEFLSRHPGSSMVDACTIIRMKTVARTDQWRDIACSRKKITYVVCQKPITSDVFIKNVSMTIEDPKEPSICQSSHYFRCKSGDCVADAFICDSVNDCADASDEDGAMCQEREPTLFCASEQEQKCVSLSLLCDGKEDLRNTGGDEISCNFTRTCPYGKKACGSGNCINENLFCNGVKDCEKNEDEDEYCDACAPGFIQCYDGSCIPKHAECDGTVDCPGRNHEDEYDECEYRMAASDDFCSKDEGACDNGACYNKTLECIYDIDIYGIQVGCRDMTHLRNCETFECSIYMYKCPDSYCIPLRLRCNEEWDCPNGEDENHCDDYVLPNFYRCRSSKQYLSPLEVCDGVKHCPSGDDEQFCGISCPPSCTCSGFVVDCVTSPANYLSLADVQLLPVSARYLNLSGCFQRNATHFFKMINEFTFLHTLDLSHNYIESLPADVFKELFNLRNLDLSFNNIRRIPPTVLTQALRKVDIEANPIGDEVLVDTFKNLQLTLLRTDYRKFCCDTGIDECYPEEDPFSSCKELMKEPVLRAFIWILGVSAFVGNIFVLVWRLRSKEINKVQGYLIQNLAVSDLFMGVYLLVIASADAYYYGDYIDYAKKWKDSFVCSLAGFLAAFSSEMSVFILTVITVDRFICIVYPFGGYKLRPKSAIRVLVLGWILVFVVSFAPIIFVKADKFYGANSVCLALPISHHTIPAPGYAMTFFFGVNSLSFLVMAFCYITMYVSVKKSSNNLKNNINQSTDNKKRERKMAAKMAFIVLTDMACWLPIIIMGILARSVDNLDIPGTVVAWTAVFILPLNSALNPYLYTFSSYVSSDTKKKSLASETSTMSIQQKEVDNIQLSDLPETVLRKRQLLPFLRQSSKRAVLISSRLETSEGGGIKDEELESIEEQYLQAVQTIKKCRQGSAKPSEAKQGNIPVNNNQDSVIIDEKEADLQK